MSGTLYVTQLPEYEKIEFNKKALTDWYKKPITGTDFTMPLPKKVLSDLKKVAKKVGMKEDQLASSLVGEALEKIKRVIFPAELKQKKKVTTKNKTPVAKSTRRRVAA